MAKTKVYRHGDITFIPIETLPLNLKKHSKTIAEGETSGHFHQFLEDAHVQCFVNDQDQQFVKVIEPSLIDHPEHKQEQLPKGNYQVRRSRELDLTGIVHQTMD